MTYFFHEYPTNPDTNPELSGDYEPVDYDDYEDNVTDDDVTNLDNKENTGKLGEHLRNKQLFVEFKKLTK